MPRVLVIDDNEDMCNMLKLQLELEGFEVAAAADGARALGLLARQPADIIVIDLFMPNRDGIETIVELRKRNPEAKIVAMSGWQSPQGSDYLEVARVIGAAATLKPFDPGKLVEILRGLLQRSA
jgi:DNA-binding response OmpR family regulator